MRTWTRAALDHVCGRCGLPIGKGDPLVRVTLAGVGHALLRCQACESATEGTMPPPDLPTEGRTATTRPALDFTRLGLLPLDFSRREPGMEG
jgi:hypothetical protein